MAGIQDAVNRRLTMGKFVLNNALNTAQHNTGKQPDSGVPTKRDIA